MSIKNTQLIIPNLCIFLTGILLTLAVPAEIYKWVDDEGNVHYGEKPPNITTDGGLETIKIKDDVDTSNAERASEAIKKKSKSLDKNREKRKKEKKDLLAEKEKLAKRKKSCENLKKRLATHQNPRVAYIDDGEYTWLDEEEKQSNIKKIKEKIEKICNY